MLNIVMDILIHDLRHWVKKYANSCVNRNDSMYSGHDKLVTEQQIKPDFTPVL